MCFLVNIAKFLRKSILYNIYQRPLLYLEMIQEVYSKALPKIYDGAFFLLITLFAWSIFLYKNIIIDILQGRKYDSEVCNKAVPKNFAEVTGKHLWWQSFLRICWKIQEKYLKKENLWMKCIKLLLTNA